MWLYRSGSILTSQNDRNKNITFTGLPSLPNLFFAYYMPWSLCLGFCESLTHMKRHALLLQDWTLSDLSAGRWFWGENRKWRSKLFILEVYLGQHLGGNAQGCTTTAMAAVASSGVRISKDVFELPKTSTTLCSCRTPPSFWRNWGPEYELPSSTRQTNNAPTPNTKNLSLSGRKRSVTREIYVSTVWIPEETSIAA